MKNAYAVVPEQSRVYCILTNYIVIIIITSNYLLYFLYVSTAPVLYATFTIWCPRGQYSKFYIQNRYFTMLILILEWIGLFKNILTFKFDNNYNKSYYLYNLKLRILGTYPGSTIILCFLWNFNIEKSYI